MGDQFAGGRKRHTRLGKRGGLAEAQHSGQHPEVIVDCGAQKVGVLVDRAFLANSVSNALGVARSPSFMEFAPEVPGSAQ